MNNKFFYLIIIFLIVIISYAFMPNVIASKSYETKEIIVSKNDTLWNIASSICKNDSNLSVYEVINDIKRLNNLDSSVIYENQVLTIYKY